MTVRTSLPSGVPEKSNCSVPVTVCSPMVPVSSRTRVFAATTAPGAAASAEAPAEALAALLSSGVLRPDSVPGPGGTFHYTGTLDRESMKTAKYSPEQSDRIMSRIRLKATSDKIEIWLAPNGLPTELKFTESEDAGLGGIPAGGDVHLTWNKPLTLTAPASSDVASLADVNGLFAKGQG
ncbi:hypothetical protein GCM10009839_75840 [Catenulispora yoronensis]|uniref:Uncharacterized protein n=1 Tax=Catenulispora yoronensis TaxID=450799 RepID=A0ABN2V8U8_9ACTN